MRLVIHKDCRVRVPARKIKELFEAVTDDEADPDWSSTINLIFTDDNRIRELNRDFRSKDSPTDVLSFNIDPGDEENGTFGEIYISGEFARRQADSYGAGLYEEIIRLTCHGLLHLFGYDHIKQSDATVMNRRQEYYLSRLARTNHD